MILEAVRCGTPVLASRVPGNVGMLGAHYEGYFPHGDAAVLAALLVDCREGQRMENPRTTCWNACAHNARSAPRCSMPAPSAARS